MRNSDNQFHFRAPVITAFTDGDCWRLARYLRDRTGWDMVAIGGPEDADASATERYWEHMAVRTPDGLIVDVTGVYSEEDFLRVWCGENHRSYACLFTANDPGFLDGIERQFRHPAGEYGEEILVALGEA